MTIRALLILMLGLWPAAASAAAEIELGFLNGTYTDLDSNLEPIREGPLTIRLSSPEHQLIVHRNRLVLAPGRGDRFEAALEVEFEGEGRLVADVEGAGISQRFVDDVAARRQTVRAAGELALERSAEGIVFTVVRRGPPVALEIESGIAQQIVGVCRALAVIPFLDVGCDRLERALSVVAVPLPEPGTRFLLPAELLSPAERRFFEDLLGGAGPAV